MRARTVAVAAGMTLAASLVGAGPAAAVPPTVYYTKPLVTVLEAGTTKCPGSDQWFQDKAANIGWTYTNGDQACVEVFYGVRNVAKSCDFFFYVPDNHATGIVRFKIRTNAGFGRPRTEDSAPGEGIGVDEKPRTGWWYIGSGTKVVGFSFTDANGQAFKSKKIGWGTDAQHGVKQVCDTKPNSLG
ncbi:hypothetical protein ACIBK9_50125 [Nonomuraea sp. NPDC050227]|uniref:hypothetical protein n=1 Tax=Nonomuraea sp. NPDC050227 TaxID=3364360 RepID=UPI0037BBE16D